MRLLPNLGAAQRWQRSPTHTQPGSQPDPSGRWCSSTSLSNVPSPFVGEPYLGLPVASFIFVLLVTHSLHGLLITTAAASVAKAMSIMGTFKCLLCAVNCDQFCVVCIYLNALPNVIHTYTHTHICIYIIHICLKFHLKLSYSKISIFFLFVYSSIIFFLKYLFILLIYLAGPGLSCGMWDLVP